MLAGPAIAKHFEAPRFNCPGWGEVASDDVDRVRKGTCQIEINVSTGILDAQFALSVPVQKPPISFGLCLIGQLQPN